MIYLLGIQSLSQRINSDTKWTQKLWTKCKQMCSNKTLLTKTSGRLDTSHSLFYWTMNPEESWVSCFSAASYAMISSCMHSLTLWMPSILLELMDLMSISRQTSRLQLLSVSRIKPLHEAREGLWVSCAQPKGRHPSKNSSSFPTSYALENSITAEPGTFLLSTI